MKIQPRSLFTLSKTKKIKRNGFCFHNKTVLKIFFKKNNNNQVKHIQDLNIDESPNKKLARRNHNLFDKTTLIQIVQQ